MAQITKITVGFGYTANLGNFQSARVDCTLEATIDPAIDDVYSEILKLQEDARDQVRREVELVIEEAFKKR